MKKKINEISPYKDDIIPENDLYTRYKAAFDKLLPLNDVKPNSKEDKAFYIPDDEFDRELDCILQDVNDTFSFVIGYAGIGKSTSLRHFFGFSNSAPVLMENSEILIFPSTFNGCVIENYLCEKKLNKDSIAEYIKNDLTLRINSVCSFLEEMYGGLKERFDSYEGQMEFYAYLKGTNPRVLEHLPYIQRKNLNITEEKMKKLEYAYEKESFICSVTKLKYYLGSSLCKCQKIIAIIDDIEPLPYSFQEQLVMQYARFFECMRNVCQSIAEKPFIFNILIALRPHTYRILKGDRAFQSFFITRIIQKKNMVDLAELFQRKISYYSEQIAHEKKDSWESACTALTRLSQKFQSRYAELIKNLTLWNTRDAISVYKTVLENRTWVQRNMNKTSGFNIVENHYVFNNITVLRAITCENHPIYKYRSNCMLPNILYNTKDKNYTFLILCIFKLFHPEHASVSADDSIYDSCSLSYKEIISCFTKIFPEYPDIEDDARCAVKYLFSSKILRKNINDTDTIETLDKPESLKEDSLLYLSPRGIEIWKIIASDSVYMELCREDYYRDYLNRENIRESSFELMQRGQQRLIFFDLYILLLEIIKIEENYINYSKNANTLDIYEQYFEAGIISERFLYGIQNSIEYSGNGSDTELIEKRTCVEQELQRISINFHDN